METFNDFKLLAHAALRGFNVNIGCFYGGMDAATTSAADLWWVRVKGQGLPAEGLSVGHESYTAAIDSMVRQLKARRLLAAEVRDQRDRAKRQVSADTLCTRI